MALATGAAAAKPRGQRQLLALLAAVASSERGAVHILDFGGGMGISYVDVRSTVEREIDIHYTIVETERVCVVGRELHSANDRVAFHPRLPSSLEAVDILYTSSALQYVENYAEVLRALLAFRPKYALLVDLSAGEIPTFATAQRNVPGSVIAYWFVDVREIVRIMAASGYALRLRLPTEHRLEGLDVPRPYRLDRPCHLLFTREDIA